MPSPQLPVLLESTKKAVFQSHEVSCSIFMITQKQTKKRIIINTLIIRLYRFSMGADSLCWKKLHKMATNGAIVMKKLLKA